MLDSSSDSVRMFRDSPTAHRPRPSLRERKRLWSLYRRYWGKPVRLWATMRSV